jgi:hypothetical protein
MSMNSVWQKSRDFPKTHVYEFHLGWRSACASRTASVPPEEPLYRNFTLSLSFGIRGSY